MARLQALALAFLRCTGPGIFTSRRRRSAAPETQETLKRLAEICNFPYHARGARAGDARSAPQARRRRGAERLRRPRRAAPSGRTRRACGLRRVHTDWGVDSGRAGPRRASRRPRAHQLTRPTWRRWSADAEGAEVKLRVALVFLVLKVIIMHAVLTLQLRSHHRRPRGTKASGEALVLKPAPTSAHVPARLPCN